MGKTALIVDDSKSARVVLRRMLETLGYSNIAECEDGSQAVDLAETGTIDLIFMDMDMPVMDGITACKEILLRMEQQAPDIIALTAHAFNEHRTECADAGMSHFIAKPIEKDAIRRAIQEVEHTIAQRQRDSCPA